MNKKTSIICIECGNNIKIDEGFTPMLRYIGLGKHHPNCKNPCKANQTKMYNPDKKINNYTGKVILL